MQNHFFCPNPECKNHKQTLPDNNWFTPNGLYPTHTFGPVQRFKCNSCGSGFSAQTFSLDYCAKKKVDYQRIQSEIASSSNGRAISRNMSISPATLTNRIDRLSRQYIAFHTEQLARLQLKENLAADGFESFCLSQYFPNNIHLLVGEDSQLVYAFNYVLLRRKGRMTDKQKAKRLELDKQTAYPKRGVENSFKEVLETVEKLMENKAKASIILSTDKKIDYKRALRKYQFFEDETIKGQFMHNTISSRAARTVDNPLFSVNYMDRELRKDMANHRRETVCFARNVPNMLNRMMIYFHWHNYHKPFRIDNKEESQYQHAEKAGLDRGGYESEIALLHKQRRFLSFSEHVKSCWNQLWRKMLDTPLKEGGEYLPWYALA